jgi:hypothetical protein
MMTLQPSVAARSSSAEPSDGLNLPTRPSLYHFGSSESERQVNGPLLCQGILSKDHAFASARRAAANGPLPSAVVVSFDRYSVGYSVPDRTRRACECCQQSGRPWDTSPVDWTIYIPSAVTGVVGLAGIGGALWQAKRAREAAADEAKANREAASSDLQASMRETANNLVVSINAEDKRAGVATKRRLYAACLAAFQQAMRAAVNYRTARTSQTEEERKSLIEKQEDAQDKMYQAMGELYLIAPYDVLRLADTLSNTLISFMAATHIGPPFQGPAAKEAGQIQTALVRAMRVDLGEPVDVPE